MDRSGRIPVALEELWTLARDRNIPASEAADCLAEEILGDARCASGAS